MRESQDISLIDDFLQRIEIHASQEEMWPMARMEMSASITGLIPPDDYISSVRGIMFDDTNRVMVVRDPETCHLLPGGRRESGETIEQTLRRELLEETGYHASYVSPQPIGVLCHKHLTPYKPAFPRHLYPWFFNVIYLVKAGEYDESALEVDGYETSLGFHPPAKARQMGIRETCALFLDHAQTLL